MDKEQNVEHFLSLIRKAKRGHLKIYIGMIAGVGKTYRMLREAHDLLTAGVDVQVGYAETHGRVDTAAKLEGLPVIPRKKLFYKGKEVEEMDLQAILQIHPEVVIVDELAHTNIEGCVNEKRWQDVLDLLDAGINVITAVNIQHIESLNGEVQDISGIEVKERVPDSVLGQADEVVNIDLTAVALRVEKKVENEVVENIGLRHERFLACISSQEKTPRKLIRKVARLATHYNSKFVVLHVQTRHESADRIPLAKQRYLINHFKLASELGGEVLQIQSDDIIGTIINVCRERQISTVCVGKPNIQLFSYVRSALRYKRLLNNLAILNVDLIILGS